MSSARSAQYDMPFSPFVKGERGFLKRMREDLQHSNNTHERCLFGCCWRLDPFGRCVRYLDSGLPTSQLACSVSCYVHGLLSHERASVTRHASRTPYPSSRQRSSSSRQLAWSHVSHPQPEPSLRQPLPSVPAGYLCMV